MVMARPGLQLHVNSFGRLQYFPYGRASDRRDTRNRYRFIGVEQDEETGLCMTGPRT